MLNSRLEYSVWRELEETTPARFRPPPEIGLPADNGSCQHGSNPSRSCSFRSTHILRISPYPSTLHPSKLELRTCTSPAFHLPFLSSPRATKNHTTLHENHGTRTSCHPRQSEVYNTLPNSITNSTHLPLLIPRVPPKYRQCTILIEGHHFYRNTPD